MVPSRPSSYIQQAFIGSAFRRAGARAATRRPRSDDGGLIVATKYFFSKQADDAFKSEIEGAGPIPARIAGTYLRPHISRMGYRYMVHWRVPA